LNDIYLRQRDVELYIPESVGVFGCGGIGTWVGIFFAMVGVKRLIFIDHDSVEVHNLNRLPFTLNEVGLPKVEALKRFVTRIRPDVSVVVFNTRIEHVLNFLKPRLFNVVVECTDDVKVQNLVRKWCLKNKVPLVEAHYDYNPELNDWTITITYFKCCS